jgi:sigma-B regulation protein RsbU (phosphoserine phosphatase)
VSGDFYDFLERPDGQVYLAVADVSGKGLNAALPMAKAASLFRVLGKHAATPGELLAAVNRELCETAHRGMFVAMTVGLLDPGSGSVRLANAGNPPSLLIRGDGRYAPLHADAPPLGIDPGQAFPEIAFRLGDGALYLYSDGITETRGQRTGTPDLERLVEVLRELAELPPARRLEATVARLHPGPDPLPDDVTLLVVELPR